MRYSRSAITQLKRWYKSVLIRSILFGTAIALSGAVNTAKAQEASMLEYTSDYTNTGTIAKDIEIYGATLTNKGTIDNEYIYVEDYWEDENNNKGVIVNDTSGKITTTDLYIDSGELHNNGQITAETVELGGNLFNNNKLTVTDILYNDGGLVNGMILQEDEGLNIKVNNTKAEINGHIFNGEELHNGGVINGVVDNIGGIIFNGLSISAESESDIKLSANEASAINGEVNNYSRYSGSGVINGGTINGDIYVDGVGTYKRSAFLYNGAFSLFLSESDSFPNYIENHVEPDLRSDNIALQDDEDDDLLLTPEDSSMPLNPFSEYFYEFGGGTINGNVESRGVILNAGTIKGNITLDKGYDFSTEYGSGTGYGMMFLYNGKVDGDVVSGNVTQKEMQPYLASDPLILPSAQTEDLSSVYVYGDKESEVTGKVSVGMLGIYKDAGLKVGNGVEAYLMDNYGNLDIGAKTANLNYALFHKDSSLALTAKSESEYGKVVAENIKIEEGATLKLTLLPGFSEVGKEYTLQLLEQTGEPETEEVSEMLPLSDEDSSESEAGGFNKFTDDFSKIDNEMFSIERDGDEGAYKIKQLKEAQEIVDNDYKGAAKAWLDSGALNTPASEKIAAELADIAQHGGDLDAAIEAVSPAAAPVVQAVTTDNTTRVFNNVLRHLNNTRAGLPSGDLLDDVSVWGKAYYTRSKMDNRGDVYGFKADSTGISFGADKKVKPDLKIGLGLQYDNTDIDSKSKNRDIDVDTVAIFAYGEYKPDNWFVNGVATYGRSKYDEKKKLLGTSIKSDYDTDIIALQTATGYDIATQYGYLTPSVGLRYNHVTREKYKDSADQKVAKDNQDILTGLAGVKLSKDYGWVKPSVYVNALYDLVSDRDCANVLLTNGAGYIVKGKRMSRFGIEAGAAAEVSYKDWDFTIEYDYEGRNHYDSHTGMLTAKYNF